MTLTIPDSTLKSAGMTERDMQIEIACRLYEGGKLPLGPAVQLSGLNRTGFEEALIERGIVVYPYTVDALASDLRNLESLGF